MPPSVRVYLIACPPSSSVYQALRHTFKCYPCFCVAAESEVKCVCHFVREQHDTLGCSCCSLHHEVPECEMVCSAVGASTTSSAGKNLVRVRKLS